MRVRNMVIIGAVVAGIAIVSVNMASGVIWCFVEC